MTSFLIGWNHPVMSCEVTVVPDVDTGALQNVFPDGLELLGGVGQEVAVPDVLEGGGASPRLEATVPMQELGAMNVLTAVAGSGCPSCPSTS